MEEFILALVGGLISAAMQHELNRSDVDYQNQYNEGIYKKYNAPASQANEMADAGLSDAAIGQALSGYSGQSLTMTSAPMQPTNFDFPSFMDMMIKNKQVDSQIELNKQTAFRMHKEGIKLGIDAGYRGRELDLFNKTFDWLVLGPEMDVYNKQADYNLKDAQRRRENAIAVQEEFDALVKEETWKNEYNLVKSNIAKNYSDIGLNNKQIDEISKRIVYLDKQIDVLNLEYENKSAETDYNKTYYAKLKDILITTGIPLSTIEKMGEGAIDIIKSVLGIFGVTKVKTTKVHP